MASTTLPPLNLDHVQGDILSGLPKRTQKYIFFEIFHVGRFREDLLKLIPLIKSTADVLKDRKAISENKKRAAEAGTEPELLKITGINISFSQAGLDRLGITASIKDEAFQKGQMSRARILGDNGKINENGDFDPNWDPAFKRPERIHGLMLVAGNSREAVNEQVDIIKHIFGVGELAPSIDVITVLVGDNRPGKEKGHEHFGFKDGISNPAVKGFDTNPFPGQETIRKGKILLGRDGDEVEERPEWAIDGSFLVFRYLFQRVPEFNKFLLENAISKPGLTKEEGAELLGARLMGRWKSGAPIDITPFKDDPKLGSDPQRNNNFRFEGEAKSAVKCPYAAHVRKTNPRADFEDIAPPATSDSTERRRILRRGIQFGPELTKSERASGQTEFGRGLLFSCYQSNIPGTFEFIQEVWANNPAFPPLAPQNPLPGFDPIIGQTNPATSTKQIRTMAHADINKPQLELPVQDFVVSRGGEYFFAPAINSLRERFTRDKL